MAAYLIQVWGLLSCPTISYLKAGLPRLPSCSFR